MFQTYALIGFFLTLVGFTSLTYFVKFIKTTKKKDKFTIWCIFESVVVIFIGIFYIYAAIILAKNNDNVEVAPDLNFTSNGLEDLAANVPSNEENITEDIYSEVTEINQNEEITPELVTEEYTTISINTKDYFLEKYQNMFRDIIRNKLKNSTSHNHTIFYNNKQYRSLQFAKNPKQLHWDFRKLEETVKLDRCYEEFFIQNALLVYSFLHCLLTLCTVTRNCKKCEETEKTQQNQETLENSTLDSNNETTSPVGPFFGEKIEDQKAVLPNLALFQVKSANQSTSGSQKGLIPTNEKSEKCKLSAQILITTLIPILAVIVLYFIMKSEQEHNIIINNTTSSFEFSNITSDPNIMDIIHNPMNITTNEKRDQVNLVIRSVYDIVNKISENNNERSSLSPKMFNIINFLNTNSRETSSNNSTKENCFKGQIPSKIYYFLVFIVIYVVVIFYAKLSQVYVNSINSEKAKNLTLCIVSFAGLWLPSILELFYRVYLMQNSPNLFTDLFLALGNTNKLVTLTTNYVEAKKLSKNLNFVTPIV
ncbi:unnamed protein product [Brassicogethes aeneus]|uniref:Uncharacterized protein n=1 Tax=Brassicogethes aeneus TaxID=1431903 RepID=A0A9P0B954_BRAAE|nr:unnamed protein product [Brassicogethes aeneus]